MKKIDVGQTLQIVGNFGVILGILLLVYELNQNRDMAAAQIRNSLAQATATLMRDEAQNVQVLDVSMRGIAGEPLTPLEQQQFVLIWMAYIEMWENSHYQYRVGLFDKTEYESQRSNWLRLLAHPGILSIWCSPMGRSNSKLFVADIDELLGDAGCE